MSRAKHAKGILPDAVKIKKRRKELGKTQKGLIQHSAVELRTYQRAEQGLPILPEILNEIAVLLGTDVKEMRVDKNEASQDVNKPPRGLELFRLHCVSKIGANRLVTELQALRSKVEYKFTINPTDDVAEYVASIVEYCQTLEITDLEKQKTRILAPPGKIRAIGWLNDMLNTLAKQDVHTYVGEYRTWHASVPSLTDDSQGAANQSVCGHEGRHLHSCEP